MKNTSTEIDPRIKAKRNPWLAYITAYLVLLTLSAGQSMILAEYMGFDGTIPVEYILGMLGYWAIVAAVFMLITLRQTRKQFDIPIRRLSQGAKDVAGGDFSVYLEPIHTANKYDYIDVMFEDFNKMVEELGSIETLKNDFISNVSHEIKTPLSVIRSYAVALKKDNLTEEERRDYIGIIISASDSLTALVTNILKLNRLENQEILPATEPYDLCRQLSDIVIALEKSLEDKQIDLEVEIDDKLMLHYDSGLLELVWHNLLANAVKFTSPGGKITLTQTSDKEFVTVTISDTGCGMDEETVKHIYDKFFQGDASHSGAGNGLGLALVWRVLELVNGNIIVESEVEKGTTFTVKLAVK